MKNLSIILLFLTFSGFVYGNVSFNVDYTKKTIPANGTVELTLSAEWPQGSNSYIIYTPVMPQSLGLKMIDHITFGQSLTVNSQIVQRVIHLFKFAVTNTPGAPTETGPIFIDYRLSGSKERHHRQLSGVSFKVVRINGSFLKILVPVLGLLIFFSIILTFIIIKVSRKKKEMVVSNDFSIEDTIIEKLERIKKYKIEGNVKKYFHELDELIKEYFRKKYQIGSILDLDPETLGKSGPNKHILFTACELLKLSHNVCYAGYHPSNQEQDRIYKFLRKLLMSNRPHKSNIEDELYLK